MGSLLLQCGKYHMRDDRPELQHWHAASRVVRYKLPIRLILQLARWQPAACKIAGTLRTCASVEGFVDGSTSSACCASVRFSPAAACFSSNSNTRGSPAAAAALRLRPFSPCATSALCTAAAVLPVPLPPVLAPPLQPLLPRGGALRLCATSASRSKPPPLPSTELQN